MVRVSESDCDFSEDRAREDAARTYYPICLTAPARSQPTSTLTSQYAQERGSRSLVFSKFQTLLRTQNRQPSHSQRFPHSFAHRENITPALSINSTLFLRSFAQERKLTPVFSGISILFCRNGGVGAKISSRFWTVKRLHYMDRIRTGKKQIRSRLPGPHSLDAPEPPTAAPLRNHAQGDAIIRLSP
jgi:hypothetical protein